MLQMATKSQRAAEDVYLGEVLSSPEKISRLADEIRDLPVNQRSICDPRFFLASIDEKAWVPLVGVISQSDSVAVGSRIPSWALSTPRKENLRAFRRAYLCGRDDGGDGSGVGVTSRSCISGGARAIDRSAGNSRPANPDSARRL
jgi:hypothetical protein